MSIKLASAGLALLTLGSAIAWALEGYWLHAATDFIICLTNILIFLTWLKLNPR
ncbi:MAG TPA: hypothetical protein VH164_01295 [Ktedonobacteraceae bacterium]|jgi:hypothetical protein|nr:hypothetical protein [Ktedonobacteraceae bacterium]